MLTNRSSHPSTVVVPLDGSTAAARAVPLARVVASQLGAAAQGLYVAAPDEVGPLIDTAGLPLRHVVGDPAAEIAHAANDPAVALVVLTTQGASGPRAEGVGHVAAGVIAASSAPLLVVRPAAAIAAHPRSIRHVLIPLDGTPSTAATLQGIAALVRRLNASLDVLLVATPGSHAEERGSLAAPRYIDQPQHEWPHWCGEMVERLCRHCAGLGANTPTHVFLAHGAVDTEIIRMATLHEHDAIIMARRSHLEPGRAATLRAVLDRTPCPIIVATAPPR